MGRARALLGDLLAAMAHNNGWAGVFIHGAIRDSAELAGIDIGVKGLGVDPAKSDKNGVGEVDVPVTLGGVTFSPGERVYCDGNGFAQRRSDRLKRVSLGSTGTDLRTRARGSV